MSSNNNADEILFANELTNTAEAQAPGFTAGPPWKVLVVDDDQQIHAVTKLVLADFTYRDRAIEFINAYSGKEGRERLAENSDVAVALIDVVLETDTAGLDLVRYIREELNNKLLRIVLRTGQPGQAPERNVIVSYDINDYKQKADLTAQKLFSTLVTALRSYEDLAKIEATRRSFERIFESSSSLFRHRSLDSFTSGILSELSSLLQRKVNAVVVTAMAKANGVRVYPEEMMIVAASGRFGPLVGAAAQTRLEPAIWNSIKAALDSRNGAYRDDRSIVYLQSLRNRETVVYIETLAKLEKTDHKLIQLFCGNASVGLDNLS